MAVIAREQHRRQGGNFFAVNQQTWGRVCDLGLNPAVAYLVLARGSDAANRFTNWSINAVETHTGISRGRAKAAVETLIRNRVVRLKKKKGTLPRYELAPWSAPNKISAADRIWLPNALVTGAADEVTPLERLRQTQDIDTLRLLVESYHGQNLREDGGISRRFVYHNYDRLPVGQRGEYEVWGFRPKENYVCWEGFTKHHMRQTGPQKDQGEDFFRRQIQLTDLGLWEWVPHLFESEDLESEVIHPYGTGGSTEIEDRLGAAAHAAGRALLTTGQQDWAENEGLRLVPVLRHIAQVTMVGIARLRYRPHTTLTAAWWADLQTKGAENTSSGMIGSPGRPAPGSNKHRWSPSTGEWSGAAAESPGIVFSRLFSVSVGFH